MCQCITLRTPFSLFTETPTIPHDEVRVIVGIEMELWRRQTKKAKEKRERQRSLGRVDDVFY